MSGWWYLTPFERIVATVLAVLALCWGLMFSARSTGSRLRPAWWLDLSRSEPLILLPALIDYYRFGGGHLLCGCSALNR